MNHDHDIDHLMRYNTTDIAIGGTEIIYYGTGSHYLRVCSFKPPIKFQNKIIFFDDCCGCFFQHGEKSIHVLQLDYNLSLK